MTQHGHGWWMVLDRNYRPVDNGLGAQRYCKRDDALTLAHRMAKADPEEEFFIVKLQHRIFTSPLVEREDFE